MSRETSSSNHHNEGAVRYEPRDARLRPLMALAAALAVMVLLVVFAMKGLFSMLADRFERTPSISIEQTAGELSTARELRQLRAREKRLLSSYGVVDEQRGIVRIPIERAMAIVVEEAKESNREAEE